MLTNTYALFYRLLIISIAVLMLSACGSNPSSHQLEDAAADVPAYSDLTRQETAKTLKRLQKIKKNLPHDSDIYTGPIRNVWDRIRAKSLIQYKDNLRTEKQATVLLRDPRYLTRVSQRAEPYIYYILQEIDKRNLPRELALLPVIESAYRPTARSSSKAAGLWQFIPSTSRYLGMKTNWWYDARRDVITSTRYALDYLQMINKKFDGDWLLTLAAYNAGHGRVRQAINRNKQQGKATDFWSLRLPPETMNYVPRFLAASRIFAHQQDYNVKLHPVSNQPHFAITNIESQLDLKLAAEMASMKPADIKKYNPGFLRWSTAPKGPHRLVLPLDKINQFKHKFAQLDREDRLRWVKHRVRKGETLTGIAMKHGIGVSLLKSTNKLRSSLININQILLVPLRGNSAKKTVVAMKHRSNSQQIKPTTKSNIYIVKSGDTIWQIARRHKMSTKALLSLNNLNKKSVLQPGQRLRVKFIKTVAKVAMRN